MRKSEFKKYPDKMQKNLCLSGYFLNNWKFQGNRVSIGFNIHLTKSMHLMHHGMYIFDTNTCPVYKLIRNSDRILDGNTGRCLSVFRNQKNRQIRMGIFFNPSISSNPHSSERYSPNAYSTFSGSSNFIGFSELIRKKSKSWLDKSRICVVLA